MADAGSFENVHSNGVLLQMCQRCLSELSAVRQEVRDLKGIVHSLRGSAQASESHGSASGSTSVPSGLAMVGESPALADEDLMRICCVEDQTLRQKLVAAFHDSRIAVNLSFLVHDKSDGEQVSKQAVLDAVRGGTVIVFSNLLPSVHRVEEYITAFCDTSRQPAEMDKDVVVLVPTFRRPARSLLKELLRCCAVQRLRVPLPMLHQVVIELAAPSGTASAGFDEAELLAVLSDMDDALVSMGAKNDLYVEAKPGRFGQEKPPVPPCAAGDEALTSGADAAELTAALEAVVAHRSNFIAATSSSSRGADQGCRSPPGFTPRQKAVMSQPLPSNILLTLIGPLRLVEALSAFHLSDCRALTNGTAVGCVLWALQASSSIPAAQEQVAPTHAEQPQDLALKPVPANGESAIADGPFPSGLELSHLPVLAPLGTEPLSQASGLPSQVVPDESALQMRTEADDEKRRSVQAMFTECFRDDLLQDRRMLMSQINNLFKMRNQGESLQYKVAGYDKLHDFLVDIPGLALTGLGNRMEVKVGEPTVFEEFCNNILDGVELPSFEKPKPVPESFKQQVVEVFRRSNCKEIPARNFREYWNMVFPDNKLQCKDYGYRDVKGLLANVSILDRVGGKYSTKYVLKSEAEGFEGVPSGQPQVAPAPMSAPPQQMPLSVPLPFQQQTQPASLSARPTGWAAPTIPPPSSPPMVQQSPPQSLRDSLATAQTLQGDAPQSPQHIQQLLQLHQLQRQAQGQQTIPPQPQQLPQPHLPPSLDSAPGLANGAPPGMSGRFELDPTKPMFMSPWSSQCGFSPNSGDVASAASFVDGSLVPGGLADMGFSNDAAVSPGVLGGSRNLFQSLRPIQPAAVASGPAGSLGSPGSLQNRLTVLEDGEGETFGPSMDQPVTPGQDRAADLMALTAEHKRKRKEKRAERAAAHPERSVLFYVSSPGALSSEDRVRDPGRFDMGALQAHLRNDRHCMIVDFSTGRVLFSNQLCNGLFEPMAPLPQKDVAELILEEERHSFSTRLLYLNYGNFSIMDPQVFHIHSSSGIIAALVRGEQLAGTWWWLDFAPCEQETQAV
mmetsp:Transcript_19361/g.43552  ORF Transcript_19361/g.43552 Transcript_19361/m.43552 type:complete len:1070 (+) Transcript_19361:60-3269(+)